MRIQYQNAVNKNYSLSLNNSLLTILFVLVSSFSSINALQFNTQNYLNEITNHFLNTTKTLNKNITELPRSLNKDGTIRYVKSNDWTSGFFPGTLWQLYIFSGNKELRNVAIDLTELLRKEQFNTNDHDIGFRIMSSFGQGYKVQKKDDQKSVIMQSANSLVKRYDEKIGAIKSWNSSNGKWNYPVIIDNMMNLELLFKATELSKDSTYYKIAVKHANTTLRDHYREDFSSYHVVDYDSSDGSIIRKVTHQGYSDESTWARGQSWGLYGFVMSYRFTKDIRYLEKAKSIANFLINHPNMHEDNIPYWDYDMPEIPNTYRDVSAACIMASALYELSEIDNRNDQYLNFADTVIENIFRKYSLNNSNLPFFTNSSVGNYNKDSEISVPINYADYYLVEALMRRWAIDNKYKGTSNNYEAFKLERAAFELNSLVNFKEDEKVKLRSLVEKNQEVKEHYLVELSKADKILNQSPNPISKIVFEGKLHSHPLRIETMKSLEDVQKIFSLTLAYIVSQDIKYGNKLSEYILSWAKTTKPNGNAINIQRISPLFVTFDITRELYKKNEVSLIENWIEEFGDSLITKVKIGERKKSNWYAKHVKLMAMVGYIVDNSEFVNHAQKHYYNYIEHALNPDGTTHDFHHRDALHYHCSGLHALLEYLIVEARNGNNLYKVENSRGGSPYKSIEFLLPYVNGTKVHNEWVNSRVDFDRRRSISGDPEYTMGMPFEHWKSLWALDRAQYFQPEILNTILEIYRVIDMNYSSFPNWQIIFNNVMNTN